MLHHIPGAGLLKFRQLQQSCCDQVVPCRAEQWIGVFGCDGQCLTMHHGGEC